MAAEERAQRAGIRRGRIFGSLKDEAAVATRELSPSPTAIRLIIALPTSHALRPHASRPLHATLRRPIYTARFSCSQRPAVAAHFRAEVRVCVDFRRLSRPLHEYVVAVFPRHCDPHRTICARLICRLLP